VELGETVAEDQPLAIVMTDKASVEIPSPVAGTVARLAGKVGQMLAVGAELIGIEAGAREAVVAGGALAAGAAVVPSGEVATPGAAATAEAAATTTVESESPVRASGEKPLASPSVRR